MVARFMIHELPCFTIGITTIPQEPIQAESGTKPKNLRHRIFGSSRGQTGRSGRIGGRPGMTGRLGCLP